MIITEIQYFSSKIIRFQAIFKDTVEFTCALEFKISSQQYPKVCILQGDQAFDGWSKTCIYATPTEEITLTELDSFDEKWSGKYSKITKSWKDNWANLSTYFKYP